MKHYGPEPPWRGYSRWYGEWERGPELWEGGYVWTWVPPDNPGSFVGLLSRALDHYRDQIMQELNREVYGGLIQFTVESGAQLPRSAAAEAR